MIIFVCLDEVGGMAFHKRRQSSDRVIRKDMLETVGSGRLLVNSYTAKQFTDDEIDKVIIDDQCLEHAGSDDYVFIENRNLGEFLPQAAQVIVYRWKRKYPADFFFDADLSAPGWELSSCEEFAGHSHECIAKEIYIRKGSET